MPKKRKKKVNKFEWLEAQSKKGFNPEDTKGLSKEAKLYNELSPQEKRRVLDLQIKLCEEGFGSKSDFNQKTCWEEALRRTVEKINN